MDTVETTRSLLATIHIFAGLDDVVMDSLAVSCRKFHAEAGQVVVEQEAVASEMFVIVQGKVEVTKHSGSGDEVMLATMGPGDFFGEMCILECMPRAATVRALEPTELYVLRNGDLLKLFRRWPDQYAILMLNISRDLCRRLRSVHELLCSALLKNSTSVRVDDDSCRLE